MKIIAVNAVGLVGKTPKGGWSTEIAPQDSVHTLVAVHTEAGVTGFGSVFTNHELVQAAFRVLRPLIVGQNALEPERITEHVAQHTFWMGRGGTLTHTQSGIDIALWDILGKVTGQPVGRLLGGCYHKRVKAYASLLMDEPSRMVDVINEHREHGFRAFKIGWGPFGRVNDKVDEQIVKAARRAVGEDVDLMVDAGASDAFWPHGYKWAIRTADMLSNYNVAWFEEPLNPDSIDDYIQLRNQSRIAIAGGEVLTRRQSFTPWLTRGALDIVQPDVTKVGGLSEQRRIARLAEDCGVRYVGHGWNTALGLAADLHMAASCARSTFVEYLVGSPYIDDITRHRWCLDDDGMLAIPESAGLGVALDPDRLAQYVGDPRPLFEP